MKHAMHKRMLCLALALALLAGLLPAGAVQANAQGAGVTFQDVPNTYEAADLILDSAHAQESEDAEQPLVTDENGKVRVSIVMEQESTLEKMDYQTTHLAQNAEAMAYRTSLEREHATMEAQISRTIGHRLEVAWNLTLAANVISAWVAPEEMEAIAKLPGVKQVVPETRYEPCDAEAGTVQPQLATSSPMIGADAAWAAGYTGKGQRICIVDTGLDTDHQSVDEGAFLYALGEDSANLMTQADVAAVLKQLNIYKGYANSTGQIISDKELTADRLYVSAKIPFGYNYVDRNLDVTHDNDRQGGHGSHVAGIAAGNRYVPDGKGGYADAATSALSLGVAPDAQILVMKVFGATGGGYTSDMVVAVEDALLLGCDSINMSMGSTVAGFTDAGPYQQVFERLAQSDTIISISAGNAGAWPEKSGHGYLYAEDVNLQTAAEPGTHDAALTVASVENDGMIASTFAVGQTLVPYCEELGEGGFDTFASLDTSRDGKGTELDYLFLDSYGVSADYSGINVKEKVVFVSRGGDITFADKHAAAARAGAIACIIYNNEPGAAMKMSVAGSGASIPAVSITQADAAAIRAGSQETQDAHGAFLYATGKLTVDKTKQQAAISLGSDYYTMSSFSSWGIPGSLKLKPEITAPGGNIYSIDGETSATNQYVSMSGTSMAAPQVAGLAAALTQYAEESGLLAKTGLSQRQLLQSLLMSTADVLKDKSGLPYSMLQQGAGLANAENVIRAGSYITIAGRDDEKVKAELGDDPDRTGKYTFDFTIHNFTETAQNYMLHGNAYTQNYHEDAASFLNPNAGTTYFMDYSLKALEADVTFEVNGRTLQPEGAGQVPDLDGDGDTDKADAQALLDYAVGKRAELAYLDRADLNGDGKVTAYDAELYLEKLGGSTLLVPAGKDVTITATITLTQADREELDRVYVNGAYIETYIDAQPIADAEGNVPASHSIPVLSFYGGWDEPSMFDQMTYTSKLSGAYTADSYFTGSATEQRVFNYVKVRLNDLAGETYLGDNPFVEGDTYNPDRNAISSNGRITTMSWSLIRNAADFRASIEDPTGHAYYEAIRSEDDPENGGFDYSAIYVPNTGAWNYVQSSQNLDEAQGGWSPAGIADGTELTVMLQAAPEYFLNPADETHPLPWVDWENLNTKNVLSIPVAVDNTAPTLSVKATDSSWNNEGKTISVTVQDDRYTAAILLMTPKGGTRLAAQAVNQAVRGQKVTLEFDVSDIWGSEFQVIAVDYAGNLSTQQAYFDSYYYGPTATLLGATADTGKWPDLSSSASWDRFDSDTNLDYQVAAAADTGVYAAAYGDGYLFYVGYKRNAENKVNYNLYVLDYPSLEHPALVGENVRSNKISPWPVRSMAYVPESGGRLYYLRQEYNGSDSSGNLIYSYQLKSMDVANGKDIGTTYYFGEYGEMGRLTPTSIAYRPADKTFYMVGYEDTWEGQKISLYRFQLPEDTATIEYDDALEWVTDIGVVYSDEYAEMEGTSNFLSADRSTIAVDPSGAIYLAIRSSDPTKDYLYTYSDGTLTNTGLVRAHTAMIVLPEEGEANQISRDQATELTLEAPVTETFQGGSLQLDAHVRPWCLVDQRLTWTSSDPAVATVDETGRVSGIAEGTATITVTTEAEPNLTASIDVTIKAPTFTLSFTGTGTDGVSRMVTYDFDTKQYTTGAALMDVSGNPIVSAASDMGNYGYLWVQDQAEGEYRLHKIDPATGVSMFDSEISAVGRMKKPMLFNDFAYDDGNETTNDSEWIFATDGDGKIWCTQNRELPNTMSLVVESEDAPTNFLGITFGTAFDHEGTRFYPSYYLETSQNQLRLNNFNYSPVFGWNATTSSYKLSHQLTYLTNANGRYLDNLTYDPVTNTPILLHYTEDGAYDVYWLDLNNETQTAKMLNLGTISGYADVSGYTAEYYGEIASETNVAREALLAADEDDRVFMEAAPAQGSLHAISTPGQETAEDETFTTLTIAAQEVAASGMLTVELDENLTLVDLRSSVELSSYQQNGSTITFGYAASENVEQGAPLAVLRLKQAPHEATATVTETERGGNAIRIQETVTFSGDFRIGAMDELQAYYDTLLNQNTYSEAGKAALEDALAAGQEAIRASENEAAARTALEDAKKALDDVLTYPEELAKAAEAAKEAAEEAQKKAEEARKAAEEAQKAAEEAAASAAEDKEAAEAAAQAAKAAKEEAKKAEEAAKAAEDAARQAADAAKNSELKAAEEARKAAEEAAKAAAKATEAAQSAEAAAKAAKDAQAAQAQAEEARKAAEEAQKKAEEAAKLAGENSDEAKKAAEEAKAAQEAAKASEEAANHAKAAAETAAKAAEESNLAAAKAAAEAAQYAAEVAEMYNEICAMKLEMAQYLLEAQKTQLACAKYYALIQLSNYADKDNYAEAQQAQLADAIQAGMDAIQNAESIEAVDRALADAKAAIDAIYIQLPYTDVAENMWYYEAVQYAHHNGLFRGVTDTTFCPNRTMTRAMLVTVLYRMAGEPEMVGETGFTDVDRNAYYYPALLWAVEHGITTGVTDTIFAPQATVTREQMVTFLYRYAQYQQMDVTGSADLSQFTDAGSISNYAQAPMAWAVEHEIIHGMGAHTLAPLAGSTRAQVAAMLFRFLVK